MGESAIYFCSSPRHMLWCAALALEESERMPIHLIYATHRHDENRHLQVLRDWPDHPFETIEALEIDWIHAVRGKKGLARRLAKLRFKKESRAANQAAITRLVESIRPARVYVGTDQLFDAQWLLHEAQRVSPDVTTLYYEDGTAAYAQPVRSLRYDGLKAGYKKLQYGRWYQQVDLLGSSDRIDEIIAAAPELVLDELRHKTLRRFDSALLQTEKFDELNSRLAAEFGLDVETMRRVEVIVVLSTSTVAARLPGYVDEMARVIGGLVEAGRRVAVKFHPREMRLDYVPVPDSELIYRPPKNILFEQLVALPRTDLVVIGDVSTSLMASRHMRPDAEVVAIRFGEMSQCDDAFSALDICIVSNADEALKAAHTRADRR